MKKMLIDAVTELNDQKVIKLLDRCIIAQVPKQAIWQALNEGLDKVGRLYEKGEYSIADLMVVGMIFEDALERTDICSMYDNIETEVESHTILVGTVEGDIHDIGKNIYKGALAAGGFIVKDIGIDVSPEDFVTAALKNNCFIVGISAVLTDCIPAIKDTVDAFVKAGTRQNVKIIIGGCVATQAVCDLAGADAYTRSAIQGLKICQDWIKHENN
ncbi:MAG: cobalamin-binding protein [Eubacteriaceae bacterium]|jgi:methylmalonyl-CoA mutase cobalamin-binding domain/chain|nr:cobalamin-binding protein [Eubacteriaceae bacterium]